MTTETETETATAADPNAINWAELTDEELARSYMTCRDRKEKADAAADRADGIMKQIKAAMLARMNARGSTGFKIDGVATVSRTLRSSYACEDWTQFLSFILMEANGRAKLGRDPLDAFAFLHRRVATKAVDDWIAANTISNGLPPVGLKAHQEFDVTVRRAAT